MSRLTKKKQRDKPTLVATDSEWDKNRESPWLSTTFAVEGLVINYINKDIPNETRERLRRKAGEMGVEVLFVERTDTTNLLVDFAERAGIVGDIWLVIFFSPKDVEYAVGWTWFRAAIEDEKKIRQRNNLSGTLDVPGHRVYIKDLSGWAGKTSLKKFSEGLGVGSNDKDLMDEYKSCMYTGLVSRPEDYLSYAAQDAVMLLRMHTAFIRHFNAIQGECLDMGEEDYWKTADIPMTSGALVAATLERWLYKQSQDAMAMKFAIRKLGILDPDSRRYAKDRSAWITTTGACRSASQLREWLADDEPPDYLKQFYQAKYAHTGLDACSVRWWAEQTVTNTVCYNALVQGGRCQNENPHALVLGRGADIDISGCYGESLRSLEYPLGLPKVWSYTPNQDRMTFGEWLDRNEKELVPSLWSATVSGTLPYEQDLIYSKLVKQQDIRKAANQQEDQDIPSDFVMLRREIVNGQIHSDMLAALRAVCTDSEFAAFRDLQLVTAVAYRRKDRVGSLDEWSEAVIRDRGQYTSRNGSVVDNRTRAWATVPLEGFIGRMYERRQAYKSLGKTAEDPLERSHAAGMDYMLKLTVNVVYGVLASRYFPIGNTVLANNITARARLGVWMVGKALSTRQSITDGGCYTPDAVCFFAGKKPGIATLSRAWEWHAPNRKRWNKPMLGWDWGTPDLKTLDRLATEHVRAFWEPYGLTFPFHLEHKKLFAGAATWSKGDYAFLNPDGSVSYALRGKDQKVGKIHPSFDLLKSLLDRRDEFPSAMEYTHKSIMKLGKYRVVQSCNGYEHLKGHRPGDDYTETRVARYNNTWMPMEDAKDYQNRKNRKKTHRGKPTSWFEKYGQKGIDEVHRRMLENDLRG